METSLEDSRARKQYFIDQLIDRLYSPSVYTLSRNELAVELDKLRQGLMSNLDGLMLPLAPEQVPHAITEIADKSSSLVMSVVDTRAQLKMMQLIRKWRSRQLELQSRAY